MFDPRNSVLQWQPREPGRGKPAAKKRPRRCLLPPPPPPPAGFLPEPPRQVTWIRSQPPAAEVDLMKHADANSLLAALLNLEWILFGFNMITVEPDKCYFCWINLSSMTNHQCHRQWHDNFQRQSQLRHLSEEWSIHWIRHEGEHPPNTSGASFGQAASVCACLLAPGSLQHVPG